MLLYDTMNLQIFFLKTPFDRGKNDFSISIKNRKLIISASGPFSRGRSEIAKSNYEHRFIFVFNKECFHGT